MNGNDRTDLAATMECVLYACHVPLHTNARQDKLPPYPLYEGTCRRREIPAVNIQELVKGHIRKYEAFAVPAFDLDGPRHSTKSVDRENTDRRIHNRPFSAEIVHLFAQESAYPEDQQC